jgi:hypothetical protein
MKTKKRPQHLKLVTAKEEKDPELRAAERFFRPLVEARQGLRKPTPPEPRTRKAGRPTFFMMEHDLLTALGRAVDCPILVLVSELDRAVFTSRKNPVRLTNAALKRVGIGRTTKNRCLRQLVKAGAAEARWQGKRAPLVTWNSPCRPPKI